MKRIAIVSVGLVLIVGLSAALTVLIVQLLDTQSIFPSEPRYTLAQVRMGLRQQPKAWIGRIVIVDGSIQTAQASSSGITSLAHVNYLYPPPGVNVRFLLVPPGGHIDVRIFLTHAQGPSFYLSPQLPLSPIDPLHRLLRQIPLINQWFQEPRPQGWQTAQMFRLKLLPPLPQGSICGNISCPNAILLYTW